jgi:hypothetical protein
MTLAYGFAQPNRHLVPGDDRRQEITSGRAFALGDG